MATSVLNNTRFADALYRPAEESSRGYDVSLLHRSLCSSIGFPVGRPIAITIPSVHWDICDQVRLVFERTPPSLWTGLSLGSF